MRIRNLTKGFTLIELLVVITIIGILATGAVTVYTSQIQKARDTNRITDITALKSGVEQVYQDSSEYPVGGKGWLLKTGNITVQDYVPKLARDPKDFQPCNGATICGYAYIVASDGNGIQNGAYELSTGFENSGNVKSKAKTDGLDDDARLEIAVGGKPLLTVKATGTWGIAALTTTDTTTKIHIGSVSKISILKTVTTF